MGSAPGHISCVACLVFKFKFKLPITQKKILCFKFPGWHNFKTCYFYEFKMPQTSNSIPHYFFNMKLTQSMVSIISSWLGVEWKLLVCCKSCHSKALHHIFCIYPNGYKISLQQFDCHYGKDLVVTTLDSSIIIKILHGCCYTRLVNFYHVQNEYNTELK